MCIAIAIVSPGMRQVLRGEDIRCVVRVAEREIWQLLEAGQPVRTAVACEDHADEIKIAAYFEDLVREEMAARTAQIAAIAPARRRARQA